MGMAASQAKLLSLTSRLIDVELQAQNLEAQKIALATQRDDIYQAYNDALDATSIKVAFKNGGSATQYVDANFSSVCSYNPERLKQYCLRNNDSGKIIVSSDVKKNYESFGRDKYAFAWAMIGFDENFSWADPTQGREIGYKTGQAGSFTDPLYTEEEDGKYSLYMTEAEKIVYDEKKDSVDGLEDKYNAIFEANGDEEKKKALTAFREYFYKKCSTEIYNQMNLDKSCAKDSGENTKNKNWDDMRKEFNYYINLWDAINSAGGCELMDTAYESGENGNTWFNGMIESGNVGIMIWDDTGAKNEWSDTSIATTTNANYLMNRHDSKEEKKLEAEYNNNLEIIKDKDARIDRELSKLETERTSITTEMEAISKVRDDNIDRTFGIFS